MSLTEAEEVFASIHEDALNDVLTAFCTDRPRYLVYGSPAFVPTTTVAETGMSAIPFPGIPGGIEWRVALTIPRVDLFKQSAPLPPELSPLAPGRFSVRLGVELCVGCFKLRIDPRPHPKPQPRHGEQPPPKPGKGHPIREPTCCKLDVFAVGHLAHVLAGNGDDAIALAVDHVEIVDIAPPELEAVIECLLFMILQAVLAEIRLPLTALRVGAFQLALAQGPLIEDDQIKARGAF